MRFIAISIFFILSAANSIYCQNITISGKVISEDFSPFPGVQIRNSNRTIVGQTDSIGLFNIKLPSSTSELIFSSVGTEWELIKFKNECDYFEIVLLLRPTYDFISEQKTEKLEKKRLKQLPELHKKAYDKGIVKIEIPCFEYLFYKLN
jgi:hypothetical protein